MSKLGFYVESWESVGSWIVESKCESLDPTKGLHRSGLCPTHNRPIRDRVGRCPTRNLLVKRVEFRGSIRRRVASISGEAKTRLTAQKNGQNWWDLARFSQDTVRISSNPMIFPPNRAENCWIRCIYAGFDCFGRRNLLNQAENSSESLENSLEFDVFEGVEFHRFWRRELETDPLASGFGAWDPHSTVGVVGSGERRSGTGGLGRWPGGLDSLRSYYVLGNKQKNTLVVTLGLRLCLVYYTRHVRM